MATAPRLEILHDDVCIIVDDAHGGRDYGLTGHTYDRWPVAMSLVESWPVPFAHNIGMGDSSARLGDALRDENVGATKLNDEQLVIASSGYLLVTLGDRLVGSNPCPTATILYQVGLWNCEPVKTRDSRRSVLTASIVGIYVRLGRVETQEFFGRHLRRFRKLSDTFEDGSPDGTDITRLEESYSGRDVRIGSNFEDLHCDYCVERAPHSSISASKITVSIISDSLRRTVRLICSAQFNGQDDEKRCLLRHEFYHPDACPNKTHGKSQPASHWCLEPVHVYLTFISVNLPALKLTSRYIESSTVDLQAPERLVEDIYFPEHVEKVWLNLRVARTHRSNQALHDDVYMTPAIHGKSLNSFHVSTNVTLRAQSTTLLGGWCMGLPSPQLWSLLLVAADVLCFRPHFNWYLVNLGASHPQTFTGIDCRTPSIAHLNAVFLHILRVTLTAASSYECQGLRVPPVDHSQRLRYHDTGTPNSSPGISPHKECPATPPANNVLFESKPGNTLRTGGNPSAILDSILVLCQVVGRDLSKESRITKIEYCKSKKNPYHEYLLIHVTYVSEGKPYPQYKCVALVERNANGSRRVAPGSGAIVSSLITAASATSVVSTSAHTPSLRPAALRSTSSLSLASSVRSSSSSFDTPADDFIAIYPDGKVNKGWPKAKATMRFKEGACLSFEQLACIVEAVHELAPKYRVISTQCYWFSICVWATICHVLGDGVEYDRHEMQLMGKWANGKGRFLLQGEDAGSAVAAYKERWASWQKKFIVASQEMVQQAKEMSRKDEEIVRQNKEMAKMRAELAASTPRPSN
ncbi:hypothetical protein BDZ89DRAFT_1045296 [Hymenopellis radicata]|nr:hypothetical protein BDZ89DRAFT_1045296 [Hymenopellis radicata]